MGALEDVFVEKSIRNHVHGHVATGGRARRQNVWGVSKTVQPRSNMHVFFQAGPTKTESKKVD